MSCFPQVWAPTSLSYFTAVACALLCVPTVLGNFSICLAVCLDPSKRLRSPFNFFLVNLAVSDLLVGCIVLPFYVVAHAMEAGKSLPVQLFIPMHLLKFMSTFASAFSLAALCLDRYAAIACPLAFRTTLSWRRCFFISIGIWALSTSLPWIYLSIDYIDFLMVFAHCALLTTMVVMVITYLRVYKVLSKRHRTVSSLETDHLAAEALRQRAVVHKREHRATTTFLVVLVAFFFTYLPAVVIIYILQFCVSCSCTFRHVLRDSQNLLILSNSCLSPMLCILRLRPLRRAIIHLWRSCLCLRPSWRRTDTIKRNFRFGHSPRMRSRRLNTTSDGSETVNTTASPPVTSHDNQASAVD